MEEKILSGEELLLQYIKDILSEPGKAKLDLAVLPKEQLSLGRGLQNLASCMVEQQRRLEASATMDSLTGIGNRMAFDNQVHKLWENRMPCTVAFIDMDDLKYCNDHAGHREGDHYIQLVSSLLQGVCMENEYVFRIGGDEFVIISPWATQQDLEQRLQNARESFIKDMANKVDYHCGFSFGCTHINEATPDAYNNLLADADQRMYEYKIHQKQLRDEKEKVLHSDDVFDANYGLESRMFDALSMTMRNRYLYVCNIRTNMSRWSANIVKDFNLPGEYMYDAGNIWLSCIHPDDRQLYLDDIGAVFNGQSLFHSCQYRAKDANGYYVMCACNGYRLKGKGDEPDLFVGTIQNHGVIENVDPVTSLYNVYEFLNYIKKVQNENIPIDILVLGISGFNLINDTYGYDNGNRILKNLAQQLRELAGEDKKLFRLNGMKLAFVLPCCARSEVRELYDTVMHIIKNQLFLDNEQVKLYMAASAIHYEGKEDNGSTLLSELDYLIDMSKKEKSGELIYVDERRDDSPKHRLKVLGAVKRSILNNCEGFYLVYQPQTDYDGRVTGVEALLRWKDLVHGVVPPNEFIPWLESDISFYDLGLWILRQAMYDGLGLIQSYPDLAMGVNISYKQLERESFLDDVLSLLQQTGFPAQNLVLEFTEHCRSLDVNRLQYIVKFFNAHGIRIAADDFGSGYSSLMLLRNVEFDAIKIDQNFIRGMLDRSRDKVLVNIMIECAHRLNTAVCVEGVETEELMSITKGYNAEFYQGYLIAKPLELNALKLFMASR
ncbi:MAG: EAL domain-containing protein [Phascolarctobacterium sp.]|nr:EAL domain-containing protein [Phascolarctobacterium sp.]